MAKERDAMALRPTKAALLATALNMVGRDFDCVAWNLEESESRQIGYGTLGYGNTAYFHTALGALAHPN